MGRQDTNCICYLVFTFDRMLSMQCLILIGFNIISYYADGRSCYDTPQLDDQFANFRITNPTPRAGSAAGGDIQNPVILDSYSAVLEFKGKGNALLLFQEDGTNETHNVCLIEIGGGELYRTIGVYKSKVQGESKVGGTAISYITSDDEFRPFWIRWLDGKTNIYLGRGYEPGVSQFYSTGGALDFPVNALSISTSSANNGSWHFNIGVTTTSVNPTTFKTTTLEENISTTGFKTSSDPSYSSATTVKLLTLRTTSTPISHPSTSNAPTSKSSTLQTPPTDSPFVTNPSPSSVTTSKLSTLLTSLTTLSSVTNPSSSVTITSKSSTFQTTPKISFQTTSKTSPSTTNPGTSSATTSETSTSQTTLTASSSYTEDDSLYTRVTSAEFSSAAPANIAAVTPGHTDEDSASGFISQPTGIILTSVGTAALLTTGACVGRRMFTQGQGNKKKDVDVQSTNEDLEANKSE